jgi:hypothetical protein
LPDGGRQAWTVGNAVEKAGRSALAGRQEAHPAENVIVRELFGLLREAAAFKEQTQRMPCKEHAEVLAEGGEDGVDGAMRARSGRSISRSWRAAFRIRPMAPPNRGRGLSSSDGISRLDSLRSLDHI